MHNKLFKTSSAAGPPPLVILYIVGTIMLSLMLLGSTTNCQSTVKYSQVKNIIVIMLENFSYDSLLGGYTKANGIAKASPASLKTQIDGNDIPYSTLPQVQAGVPQDLPNGPFDLNPYINVNSNTMDLTHAFYTHQYQMNGGKMNKYVAYSSGKGLAMSYYDLVGLNHYLGQLATNYTVFDNWCQGAFGGSMLNHQWLITPHTPYFPNAPTSLLNSMNLTSGLINFPEKAITSDYYVVNTAYSVNKPYPVNMPPVQNLVPSQNTTTIGDLLTNAQISWKWYAGGYNNAMNGTPDASWQAHHQPFVFFKKYEIGTEGRTHLKDETDLFADLQNGQLPSVSFYKPLGKDNMHPGYSVVGGSTEAKLRQVIEAIKASKYWENTIVFLTFDEYGGRWDHVAPPKVDQWGPGSRIPTVAISPLVKKGHVNSIHYDTTAIMKFIQDRFGLPSISTRDASQNSMEDIFLPTSNSNSSRRLGSSRNFIQMMFLIVISFTGTFILF